MPTEKKCHERGQSVFSKWYTKNFPETPIFKNWLSQRSFSADVTKQHDISLYWYLVWKRKYVRVIDQVCGQDGWILANVFLCMFIVWTRTKSKFINTLKRTRCHLLYRLFFSLRVWEKATMFTNGWSHGMVCISCQCTLFLYIRI